MSITTGMQYIVSRLQSELNYLITLTWWYSPRRKPRLRKHSKPSTSFGWVWHCLRACSAVPRKYPLASQRAVCAQVAAPGPCNAGLSEPFVAGNSIQVDIPQPINTASPKRRSCASNFIATLREILGNSENDGAMPWSEDGRSFFIAGAYHHDDFIQSQHTSIRPVSQKSYPTSFSPDNTTRRGPRIKMIKRNRPTQPM
ncbi:hypothetical protein ASPWEDRAFT_305760 [Aspergillus wentii DTO 134E9]|uniref:HSF-type DNA-binding domain-containing protein n=1 Tax=Aspergillus wentii DTO 134E9 TaxID=1073089 RepID=A0A1L9R3U2_ASPWE|nr:uncharacterized protein ASPWEDRAFT_305760 [Aspergillus wentii DTO 134E9]OJJ29586.1 hypothetical protein ASPWEDRAFT_305760 [Aspergillus wentii DTO 134E9]